MTPRKRLSDPGFSYTPSYLTDIRKTFEAERLRLAQQNKVTPISGKRASK